jgi:hypothetical protein
MGMGLVAAKNATAEVFQCKHSVDKRLTSVLMDITDNPMFIDQVALLVRSGNFGSFV